MVQKAHVQEAIEAGKGILRLEPTWVPRSFMLPGRRLRLHPDDLYACGAHRGGINERWFSSTTNADNGPGTPADEGLSYVRLDERPALSAEGRGRGRAAISCSAPTSMAREGGWNLLCKFFDNMGPIPHHMHQSDEHAKRVGRRGKPEAYYFPPQYNPTDNNYPYTFMGLEPGTTKDDMRRCLENWNKGRQRHHLPVARVSAGARHRLADRSGHSARAGLAPHLRAAGEQRRVRDVPVGGRGAHHRLEPADQGRSARSITKDLDYIIGMLDWDANVNPQIRRIEPLLPEAGAPFAQTEPEGYREQWICYGTAWYSAKELTVLPEAQRHDQGRRRLRRDPDAGLRHVRRRYRSRRRR